MALLLVAAAEIAAQAPPHALALSSSAVRASAQEHEMDLLVLDAFEKQRRAGSKKASLGEAQRWTMFGRLGPMNFAKPLDAGADSVQFTLRRTSHGLRGKIYLGIHRAF